MFDAWRALTATKGLLIADPAAQLPDAAAALRLFGEAGFEDVQASTILADREPANQSCALEPISPARSTLIDHSRR